MKKVITLLTITAICLSMACCGGKLIKGAVTITGAGTAAYQSFDDVHRIIGNNIDAFSPRDVVRLRAAGEVLSNVKTEIQTLVLQRGSALDVVAGLSDLIPLYKKARIAYLTVDGIVMAEIDEFSRQDQMTLHAFRDTCARLDHGIIEAINSGGEENAQLVRDIVSFAIMVGKVALPLLIL